MGLSTIVVYPPAAAALVIEEKSSKSVPEQILTLTSISPGMMTFLPKSYTCGCEHEKNLGKSAQTFLSRKATSAPCCMNKYELISS